eukprot:CAMPEP_0197192302 /NCGR_PEP_ID=MMETSP1423-20130617/24853_1 /TAXON_ID=476441 /ORGANISM="Pseudo-nitzschia heimii, Strain UNC1101" /LENGTH=626 /DNA_ID=CAMNT_0042645161 /DNA_START=81 /DNA_END=1962 /DNA_ORIENTATION=+
MIPGGDHSSRSLLFRRVRSWSDVAHRTRDSDTPTTGDDNDGQSQELRQPLLQLNPSDRDDSGSGNSATPMLLPTLEYEIESDQSSVDADDDPSEEEEEHPQRQCSSKLSTMDLKLWIVFGFLVASGVGNVIFAKLQSLPMKPVVSASLESSSLCLRWSFSAPLQPISIFKNPISISQHGILIRCRPVLTSSLILCSIRYNYPTFLNIYANGMYVLMSFAYIIPVSAFGLFGNSFPRSIPIKAIKPFFVMGALDALSAAMQILATVYLPGTLLVLIPQVAIPLSMAAGTLILGERYTVQQCIGATVVFCGILVVLHPILSHQRDAEYYCEAIDTENDCLLCKEETTEEICLSHNAGDKEANHTNSTQQSPELMFWRDLEVRIGGNASDDGLYCAWVSREEADAREEDFLVFFWSIVMLLSCVPSVMSTVYKQVALQTASSMDPIVISGWVSLFQFISGLFLVIPSGLVSSPRVHPLDLRSNWLDGIGCLFAQINAIDTGCHPDDCAEAALWVHVSLLNSAVYALSMLFVLKYGSCDLMYLGLTLVVPLGHLAFDINSSFSELQARDIAGLVILVAGLIMYRFGHGRKEQEHPHGSYEPMADSGDDNRHDREGFLEFLREPFMLAGDI